METHTKMLFVPGLGRFGVKLINQVDPGLHWKLPTQDYFADCDARRLQTLEASAPNDPILRRFKRVCELLADKSRTGNARRSMNVEYKQVRRTIARKAHKLGLRLPPA
jgi:hypothetical protein